MTDLSELSASDFEAELHTVFRFTANEGRASVELELAEHHTGRAQPGIEQFGLIFAGPGEPALAQATYRIEHPRLGSFELFVVPVGRRDGGLRYEAAFSRLLAVDQSPPAPGRSRED